MNMKEIECQGEGCGRMAKEVDENYYGCDRCGWAGSENNPVVVLEKQVRELESMLRDCHDLLNDCGYYFVNDRWVDGDNPDDMEE
jgi:hypothetical protein